MLSAIPNITLIQSLTSAFSGRPNRAGSASLFHHNAEKILVYATPYSVHKVHQPSNHKWHETDDQSSTQYFLLNGNSIYLPLQDAPLWPVTVGLGTAPVLATQANINVSVPCECSWIVLMSYNLLTPFNYNLSFTKLRGYGVLHLGRMGRCSHNRSQIIWGKHDNVYLKTEGTLGTKKGENKKKAKNKQKSVSLKQILRTRIIIPRKTKMNKANLLAPEFYF